MRTTTHPSNNLIVSQVKKILDSESRVQRTVENNRERKKNLVPKMRGVHLAKHPYENNAKLKKTKLRIKNMMCMSCKIVLKAVLDNLGLNYSKVNLGEVEIIGKISEAEYKQLKSDLLKCGLELMEDRKNILVEKIRLAIIEMIHYSDKLPGIKTSVYLSEKFNTNYTYLSNLFSEVKGTSIQKFIILQKIERAKELLVYNELTISEIAWELNYSSPAHLTNQFKRITGLPPTYFKNIMRKRRNSVDRFLKKHKM